MDGLILSINNLNDLIVPYSPSSSHLALLAFAIYLLLIVGGGLWAVLSRNLVRALVGLIITFLGVAGMYLLLASPFLAFMQLLIYIGAISVLIFFSIMLVNNLPGGEESKLPPLQNIVYGFLAALAPLAVVGPFIYKYASKLPSSGLQESSLKDMGQLLLEKYVIPFELISIILLVAMAGGVLLAWERRVPRND